MTKAIVAALLAASSILPGVAAAQDQGGRDRPTQTERQARAERRADRDNQGGDATRERQRPAPEAGVGQPQRGDDRPDRPGDRGGWNGRDDRGHGRPDDRGQGWNGRGGNDRGGYDRRDDNRGQGWGRPGAGGRWSNDWRRDGRYDWNRYRSYNREAFRLPRYYAPGGWGYGYRRFGVGVRISGVLFGRNYWIADPWAYRLPAAYGPYRWVRYYNDAVLVDVRTGYVADVIYGIFW